MSPWVKWSGVVVSAGVVLVLASCSLTRAGYQSPRYEVRERLGVVEVREYPALVLVQTPTPKEAEGRDGSFMRLFRFLSKGNALAQPIPMTTPVLYRGEGSSEAMAFVLPSSMQSEAVPAPLDAAVQIQSRPAGTYAAMRWKGHRGLEARERALLQIRSALEASGWQLEGLPEFAYYDPPWIPRFLEKNEVHWRVVERQARPNRLPLKRD